MDRFLSRARRLTARNEPVVEVKEVSATVSILPDEILIQIRDLLDSDTLFRLLSVCPIFLYGALERRYKRIRCIDMKPKQVYRLFTCLQDPLPASYVTDIAISGLTIHKQSTWKRAISAFPSMLNVRTLRFEGGGMIPQTVFKAAWKTFGPNLNKLSLSVPHPEVAQVLYTLVAPNLVDFHYFDVNGLKDGLGYRAYDDPGDAFTPLFAKCRHCLKSLGLTFFAGWKTEISSMIFSLVHFDSLERFCMRGTYYLYNSEPDILGRFLLDHGSTLRECVLEPFNPRYLLECRWMQGAVNSRFLPHLTHLSLRIADLSYWDIALEWIARLSETLESLNFTRSVLDIPHLHTLCEALRHSDRCQVLKHLRLSVKTITPSVLSLLASSFPLLESLELGFHQTSDDDDNVGIANFMQAMTSYRFDQWHLRRVMVEKSSLNHPYDPETVRMVYSGLVDCIPSLYEFEIPAASTLYLLHNGSLLI